MLKTKHFVPGIFALILLIACSGNNDNQDSTANATEAVEDEFVYIPLEQDLQWQSKYANRIKPGPRNNDRIEVRRWGDLAEIFNDSNKYQYAYAEKFGIDPIVEFNATYKTKLPLVKVTSCKFYNVEPLTHSVPYLVPRAEMLLRDIGRNFIDSLAARGADGYRIDVTSLLRTKASIKKLKQVNINATDSSTHQFGTTFDLSWNYFACADTTRVINTDDMKWLLAEVLEDMRKQGRCMVKYEKKTHCFHITVTK